MLSKTQSKYIRSLALQKFRKEYQSFIAEGEKIVAEWLLSAHKIEMIVGVDEWIQSNQELINKHPEALLISVTEKELQQISSLQTANKTLIVVKDLAPSAIINIQDWCIALDGIRDPGNMGTILRIADWYGIQHVVCAPDCVDAYSPKVVQAAMGAHLRISIYESDIATFIASSPLPTIAATLGGTNVYDMPQMDKGIIIIGNEAKGIQASIIKKATYNVTIPRIGGAESLNAGVSTGILCALLVGRSSFNSGL